MYLLFLNISFSFILFFSFWDSSLSSLCVFVAHHPPKTNFPLDISTVHAFTGTYLRVRYSIRKHVIRNMICVKNGTYPSTLVLNSINVPACLLTTMMDKSVLVAIIVQEAEIDYSSSSLEIRKVPELILEGYLQICQVNLKRVLGQVRPC